MSIKIREKQCKDGKVSIYLDIHHRGLRRYEYLNLKFKKKPANFSEKEEMKMKRELAKRIALQRETDLISGEFQLDQIVKGDADFFAYFQSYIDKNRGLSDIRCYTATLNKLKAFSGKDKFYFQELTESFLERFSKYLQKHHQGESAYNYFKKLKRIIKAAVKEKLLRYNPAVDISCSKQKGMEKDVLTIYEIKVLYNTPCSNKQVKDAFLFCCFTGLRYCDIKVLMWRNLKTDQISMRQQKTKEQVVVFLCEDAKMLVGKRQEQDSLVYQLPTHNGCLKHLRKWVKDAGIEKHVTWHCARHSFGTNLIQYGSDILVTSKLLGHKSTRYTIRYTRVSERLKQEAISRIPSISK
jgi:integrase/recombinase XerD